VGKVFAIKCTNCDYKKEFMIGIGMMYSPERVTSDDSETGLLQELVRSKKTQEIVKNLLRGALGTVLVYMHKS
jgi:hypothetical protein